MSEIKNEMKRGLFWTALDKYSGQIIGIVISMILARLLTPYDYGVVAAASVLLGFLSIFSSIGIGPAIIQRKDLSQSDLDNIFTFSILLGIFIGGLSFLSSWPVADFYGNSLLKPVIQILSLGLFFGTINMVPAALMSKHKRFKEMATRSLTFQVLFGIIGVISAFWGAGVYALVCPQILASLCTFLYNNHFYPVRISWRFSIEPIKRIFAFSLYVFLFELVNYFSRNLDKIIIGKYISADALGYYEKSYRLMQLPMNNISAVVYPVLQPIMSQLQDDLHEMSRKFLRIVEIISCLSFPVGVILYFGAYDIILLFFGDRWLPSVPVFQILALSVPLGLLGNPTGAIFMSCNASKRMFYTGIANTLVTITGFIIAAVFWGTVESIAWAWTISNSISVMNCYYQLFVKVMNECLLPILKTMLLPLFNVAILIPVYYFLLPLQDSWMSIPRLFLNMAIGGVTILFFMNKVGVISFVSLYRKLKHKE